MSPPPSPPCPSTAAPAPSNVFQFVCEPEIPVQLPWSAQPEETTMKVTELQQAILDLSDTDYAELVRWLRDQDWERWEQEFDRDVRAGRLDAMAAKALEAKAKGQLEACRCTGLTRAFVSSSGCPNRFNGLHRNFDLLKANPQHPSLRFPTGRLAWGLPRWQSAWIGDPA